MAFPHFRQLDRKDCGPTCLRIVSSYYGKDQSVEYLRKLVNKEKSGTSLYGLSIAAREIGFDAEGVKLTFSGLDELSSFPCIAYWNQNHYVVVYKIKRERVYISDPAFGLITLSVEEFLAGWIQENGEGIILVLEPTSDFYSATAIDEEVKKNAGKKIIYKYLKLHKRSLLWVLFTLGVGSVLQMALPFITQKIVDSGIVKKDINFIYLLLIAQLALFTGRLLTDVIKGRMLIRLGNRINISLVSEFFAKLMRLPISFYDSKMVGDITQRVIDHKRIESFLTQSSLTTMLSMVNFIVFSIVLGIYSIPILLVFFGGGVLYFLWITYFLRKREQYDHRLFQQYSKNQSKELELLLGMQEIKQNNAQSKMLRQWNELQKNLFDVNLKNLHITQIQNFGAGLINELKNIFITFYSAMLVINGEITLGIMLAISFIIGQLNGPIAEFVNFLRSWQDARLSLERIAEIHEMKDEESSEFLQNFRTGDILLDNLSFKYNINQSYNAIDELNFTIPENKITAIVGTSGSGKTTLMKLILKGYDPRHGKVVIGGTNLTSISPEAWRGVCGVVMQDGYIFSDTLKANIAIGEERIDVERFNNAIYISNLDELIKLLPMGVDTMIGSEGTGLSQGQKQRILIARAVYKNAKYLFLDEATSALDANNERIIMERMKNFYKGRTVVIIAHRLSTVKNADQIIVMEKGRIIEAGSHEKLTYQRGTYFELVRNQLELGN